MDGLGKSERPTLILSEEPDRVPWKSWICLLAMSWLPFIGLAAERFFGVWFNVAGAVDTVLLYLILPFGIVGVVFFFAALASSRTFTQRVITGILVTPAICAGLMVVACVLSPIVSRTLAALVR
jgi:hypothetical protein